MIDLTLNQSHILIVVAIVAYVIVISIATNKYHSYLDSIKKQQLRLRHKRISEVELQKFVQLKQPLIKKLKTTSYGYNVVIGLMHGMICFVAEFNLLSAIIPFFIFLVVLVVNYWLKGSKVSASIRNLPGVSDYHGM